MKAQAIAIKRSTLVSVLLVGAVIAICSATNARAEQRVPEAQGNARHFEKQRADGVAKIHSPAFLYNIAMFSGPISLHALRRR